MNWKGKHVLVTGGTGFIGQNLVRDLVKKGALVKIFDVNPRRYMIFSDVKCHPFQIQFEKVDLTSPINEHIFETLMGFEPEYIFHLASDVGGIKYLLENQEKVFINNAKINLRVLDIATKCPSLKGFLNMSSACVYPKEGGVMLKEDEAIPADPHSSYGWSKLFGEMLVKNTNIPSVNIRMFNVYGPYENFDPEHAHVIPALISKIIKANKQINVFGSGNQARAFVYIDDAIRGMKNAITSVTDGSSVNIGPSREYTIKDIVQKLMKISGRDLKVRYDKSKPEGELHRSAYYAKAWRQFKWEPKVSFDKGLKLTYNWAKENIEDLKC